MCMWCKFDLLTGVLTTKPRRVKFEPFHVGEVFMHLARVRLDVRVESFIEYDWASTVERKPAYNV